MPIMNFLNPPRSDATKATDEQIADWRMQGAIDELKKLPRQESDVKAAARNRGLKRTLSLQNLLINDPYGSALQKKIGACQAMRHAERLDIDPKNLAKGLQDNQKSLEDKSFSAGPFPSREEILRYEGVGMWWHPLADDSLDKFPKGQGQYNVIARGKNLAIGINDKFADSIAKAMAGASADVRARGSIELFDNGLTTKEDIKKILSHPDVSKTVKSDAREKLEKSDKLAEASQVKILLSIVSLASFFKKIFQQPTQPAVRLD